MTQVPYIYLKGTFGKGTQWERPTCARAHDERQARILIEQAGYQVCSKEEFDQINQWVRLPLDVVVVEESRHSDELKQPRLF